MFHSSDDEIQAYSNRYTLPAYSSLTLPLMFPFGILAIQIIFVGLTKRWQ